MVKKIIIILSVIICLGLTLFLIINNVFNKNKEEKPIIIEAVKGNIVDYNIFGMYFNVEGFIELENIKPTDFSLVLKGEKKEINVPTVFTYSDNVLSFKTSEYLNDGIILDSLEIDSYYFLLKDNTNNKYYSFLNNTTYEPLTYYTITRNNKNNEISILFNETLFGYGLNILVQEKKLPSNVYDITIDPGHGGRDSGALGTLNGTLYMEKDINLLISLKLKEELEKLGYKVLITRETDLYIESYGDEGRAVLPNKYKTKLNLSIHQNSDTVYANAGGVEVYIANDSKADFAINLANDIVNSTNTSYSYKLGKKIDNGVYFLPFTEYTIEESLKEWEILEYEPYEPTIKTPYMFMIREVGGKKTHAYVDGRNPRHGYNPYYLSNQTAEPYLLELGYIIHPPDLESLLTKPNLYATSIARQVDNYLKDI